MRVGCSTAGSKNWARTNGFTTALRATIYEASARDLRIVVVSDAVGNGSEAAVQELARIGVYLLPSTCCLDWLAGAAPAAA
jgi:uridine phosphorylase